MRNKTADPLLPARPGKSPYPAHGHRPAHSAAPQGLWGRDSGPRRLWRRAPRPQDADQRRRPPAVGGPEGSSRQGRSVQGPALQLAQHPARPHSSCRGDTVSEKGFIRKLLSSMGNVVREEDDVIETQSLRGAGVRTAVIKQRQREQPLGAGTITAGKHGKKPWVPRPPSLSPTSHLP